MAYIGTIPAEAYTSFAVQHFTTSATTSYTLDNPVANENEIALFINNVRQEPGSGYAYTASGTTLTLSAATTISDTMYCVFIGKAVQTVTPAVGSVTNDMLAGSISPSKVSNLYPYRNLIINGDMSIAQRGTSASGLTSTGFACDRFQFASSGTIGTYTLSQSTTAPDEFGYSLKLDTTTADASPTGTDNLTIRYKIEGQHLQHLAFGTSNAKSITLSFWCRSNKTGNFQVNIRNQDANRMISSVVTINSADTWEYKNMTFVGDTASGFNNDNGESLRVEWFLDVGTDWSTGTAPSSWETTSASDLGGDVTLALADNTANEFYLTGVQLEVGTSATPFEFLPYDVNLKRCRRYYFQPEFGTEHYLNTIDSDNSYRRTNIVHPNSMRASPTGTVTTSLGGGGTHSSGKPTVSGTNKDSSAVNGDLTGNAGFARIVTLTLDAEL